MLMVPTCGAAPFSLDSTRREAPATPPFPSLHHSTTPLLHHSTTQTFHDLSKPMKTTSSLILAGLLTGSISSAADPRVDSWFTQYSAKYARLYATTADLNSGNAVTT